MLKNEKYLKNYALVFINIENEDLQHRSQLGLPHLMNIQVWTNSIPGIEINIITSRE